MARGERLSPSYEFTALSKDGREIEVESSVAYLQYRGGVAALGTLRDISNRRNLEQQLLRAGKIEAIERLTTETLHELNNFLTVIVGHADLLHGALDQNEPLRARVEEIRSNAGRAAEITGQMRLFSRRQAPAPEAIDLNRVLDDTERLLRRLVGENVLVLLEPADEPVTALVDPGLLEQLIVSLAASARDAIVGGGALTLSTRTVTLERWFVTRHQGAGPGRYAELVISDTGKAIPPDQLAAIFEPFRGPSGGGRRTGVGLANARKIVTESDGIITVKSEVGAGTSFMIYLPAAQAVLEGQVAENGRAPASNHHATILVVEDEDGVRDLARDVLKEAGYEVLTAVDGVEALRVAEEHDSAIDVLLTDVVMPALGGAGVGEALSASRPEMRIVYMSGYSETEVYSAGHLEPGTPLLRKPFSPDQLLDEVGERVVCV
jgi:signal transduction histidine kinase